MDDAADIAQEHLDHAAEHHAAAHGIGKPDSRRVKIRRAGAIMIAVLGAVGTLTDMAALDSQTSYLSHLIKGMDTYAEYQGKSTRRLEHLNTGELEAALPETGQLAAAIQRHAEQAKRLQDEEAKGDAPGGMKQLLVKAQSEEAARDRAKEEHDHLEIGFRFVSLSLILVGLSLAMDSTVLLLCSMGLGAAVALGVLGMILKLL